MDHLAPILIQVLNGLQYGLLLFLVASGLTLIFGIMGVINLAHGSFYMIGAYFAWSLASYFGNLLTAILVGIVLSVLLGLALERLLIRHFYGRDHLYQVLLTYGLILICGPTGCGKTMTLYSCLRHINQIDTKLLTVEDPVEFDIEGIMQVQVNESAGMTFGKALRAFLRQDPDIIMLGEIRDLETAQIAVQARFPRGHWQIERRRILGVKACHCLKHDCAITHVARHGACLVQRACKSDHAPTRAAAIGWLDAANAHERRRLTNRAASVRSRRRRAQPRGNGG
jgi:hypothetical protein